jgi:hypothetical protein
MSQSVDPNALQLVPLSVNPGLQVKHPFESQVSQSLSHPQVSSVKTIKPGSQEIHFVLD